MPSPLVAAFTSPACVRELPRRTWMWIGLYLAVGFLLLGAGVLLWHTIEDDVSELITSYVMPDNWPSVTRWLFQRLTGAQAAPVVINAVVTGVGLLVSLVLFAFKWRIATSYAAERRLVDAPPNELPRLVEVWQELQLALAFIAAQGAIFWLGYFEVPALKVTATVLSYLMLFATYAINFVAPLFQRHHGFYSQTVKVLLKHPLAALVFGGLFALPVVAMGFVWKAHPEWTRTFSVSLVVAVSLVSTAWAQAAGTKLAAALFPTFERTPRSGLAATIAGWVVLLAVLGGNGWLFGHTAALVHHKSQILKCDYSVDLASTKAELPSLRDLLDGKLYVGVSANIRVHNPTPFDLSIEQNRIEVRHKDKPVATSRVTPFTVRSKETIEQRLTFKASLEPSALLAGLGLFKSGWTITLYLEAAPGFELPVYLLK